MKYMNQCISNSVLATINDWLPLLISSSLACHLSQLRPKVLTAAESYEFEYRECVAQDSSSVIAADDRLPSNFKTETETAAAYVLERLHG